MLNVALTHQNRSYRDLREEAGNLCLVSSLQPVGLECPYKEHESSSRLSLKDQRYTQAPLPRQGANHMGDSVQNGVIFW